MKNKKNKNKRTGLKVFIVLGLVGIVAACAWILSNWNKAQQAETGRIDADLISYGAESVEAPDVEVKVRTNASDDYHVISTTGNGDLLESIDKAIDAGTMNIELEVSSADGTLNVNNDSSGTALSEIFDKYGKTVGYVIGVEDEDTEKALVDIIEKYSMADNITIESYDADILKSFEDKYPDMDKVYLCRTPDDRSRGLGLECADIICMTREYMNEYGVNAVHSAGKKFAVRTIESEAHITYAIGIGVDIYYTGETALAIELDKQQRN